MKKTTPLRSQIDNPPAHFVSAKIRNGEVASSKASSAPEIFPSHEEIAVEAEVLWRQKGCPSDCDETFWLEAEQQLLLVAKTYRMEQDDKVLVEPLSRLDRNSDDVMGELEELFPLHSGALK